MRNKPSLWCVALAVVLVLACVTRGVAGAAVWCAPLPPGEDALGRWVDDLTVVVVRIDLTRVGLAEGLGTVRGIVAELEKGRAWDRPGDEGVGPMMRAFAKELEGQQRELAEWERAFAAAGGREIWVLARLGRGGVVPAIIVPLAEGADAEKLAAMVRGLEPVAIATVEVRDGAVVGLTPLEGEGDPRQLPRRREEGRGPGESARIWAEAEGVLAAAEEGAGAGAGAGGVRAAVLVAGSARPVIYLGLVGVFAETDQEGAVQAAESLRWVGIGVGPMNAPVVRVVAAVSGGDEMAADVARRGTDFLRRMHQAGPTETTALLAQMRFEVRDGRVVLELDQGRTRRLVSSLLAPLVRARESARTLKSSVQVRQIVQACQVYALEHNDEWPASLAVLVKKGLLPEGALQHPDPARGGYVYLRPKTKVSQTPEDVVIVREMYTAWPRLGVIVGFADGTVGPIMDPKELKMLTGEGR